MATRGPGLAATSMRADTVANVNRGRIRGWAGIAAALLVVLAALSWPYLPGVVVFLVGAVACLFVLVWVHRTLPDVEKEQDGRDSATGGHD